MALQSFQQSHTAVQCLDTAQKRFLDGHLALSKAKAQLQKFQSRSANGTGSKLPASLSLKIVYNLRLPEVPGDASFYKEELAVLTKLEIDAQKTIFEQIVAARTRHMQHLAQQSNAQAFIAREMATFKQIVSTWADQHDSLLSAAPSADSAAAAAAAGTSAPALDSNAFPRQCAIDSFESSLHRIIQGHAAMIIQKSIDAAELQQQRQAAENNAQQNILAGAHTGQTITKLAERAAQKAIQPLRKQLVGLEGQVAHSAKRKDHPSLERIPATARASTSSSSDIDPWHGGLAFLNQHQWNSAFDHQQPKRAKAHNKSSKNFHSGGGPRNTRQPPRNNHDDDTDMNTDMNTLD